MVAKAFSKDGCEGLRTWMEASVGQLAEPQRLPSERHLAERFGVSRRHVRQVLAELAERDLVVRKHGSGNYLCPAQARLGEVCVLCGHVKADDPLVAGLMGGIAAVAASRGVRLVPLSCDGGSVGGDRPAIVIGRLEAETRQRFARLLSRAVVLGDGGADFGCSIGFDDVWIGREAYRQLVSLGHERLLLLSGPSHHTGSARREQGWREVAGLLGHEPCVLAAKMNWRGGYEVMREYLAGVTGLPRCSGVFAASDWMAAGALHAIREAGVAVPQEMSLIGCGDVPLAEQLEPPLATFRLDARAYVRQAFMALEQAQRYDVPLPRQIVLPAEFVSRASLGPGTTRWTMRDF